MSHSPRTLVAFYSRSNHTRKQGQALAERFGADVEVIVPKRAYRWPGGLWRAGRMAFTGEIQELEPSRYEPGGFDVVVIGTPVWAWHAAPPVRSWLHRHREQLPRLACFATYGGVGAAKVIDDTTKASGQALIAQKLISHRDEAKGRDREKIEQLATEVERAASGPVAAASG